MRRTTLLIGLIVLFFDAPAQIIKEHAFDDQASVNMQVIKLENSGQKICVVNRVDSISYQVIFYDLDYTEFKTVSIDLAPLFIITNYSFPSLIFRFVSENVFDQDPDIDLLCQLTYFDADNAEYAQVLVIHENGSVLFESDVNNSNAWLLNSSIVNSSILPSLVNTEDGTKMILDVFYFGDNTYSYDVYSLPGVLPSSMKDAILSDEIPGNYLRAYPVPANESVTLEYKLAGDQRNGIIEITDDQGKTIQKLRIDVNQGMIRMPVSGFSNGLYFYRLNTRRGVPRSGKMMILR